MWVQAIPVRTLEKFEFRIQIWRRIQTIFGSFQCKALVIWYRYHISFRCTAVTCDKWRVGAHNSFYQHGEVEKTSTLTLGLEKYGMMYSQWQVDTDVSKG